MIRCKNCKFCKALGRSNKTINNNYGRKNYFCENDKLRSIRDNCGNPIYNFIGYGTDTFESPLIFKTQKKWCPLKENTGGKNGSV